MPESLPRMYTDFASWFHLLTAPADYAEEAEYYSDAFAKAADAPLHTLLELGSGGGNMASHYKTHFQSTLVDPSVQMLALSQGLNPECEHIAGDMRTLRLGRSFDAVFVHDAVMYMTTEADLRLAMETAFVHCRPGGVAVFAPDYVRETFVSRTSHGGHDGNGRGMRYLEWTHDPDPSDTTFVADYAYVFYEEGKATTCALDQHTCGLFGRATWLSLLEEVGFSASVRQQEPVDDPPVAPDVFVAVRPPTRRET